ncbi:hypothetical protein EV356DRAFT_506065 [Viridothelium virens]|uniref:Secreted protein n=1 Tax=Viridothelium virens TaxID=1048519 RepID=A0A6A6HLJ5_VIRVR|nr:hypothetical protein EV356DRAFT_506065 [Viridothelium virens]
MSGFTPRRNTPVSVSLASLASLVDLVFVVQSKSCLPPSSHIVYWWVPLKLLLSGSRSPFPRASALSINEHSRRRSKYGRSRHSAASKLSDRDPSPDLLLPLTVHHHLR